MSYLSTNLLLLSFQLCPTLCDLIDGSPPGSPVPGILQARTLEWVVISFSSAWKWKVKMKSLSRVRLLATPWPAAYQYPPSMGFSRQEFWSGVPLPSLINYNNSLNGKGMALHSLVRIVRCLFLLFSFFKEMKCSEIYQTWTHRCLFPNCSLNHSFICSN